ncbi:ATP-grasp domain-containing protein [Streptomyces lunaelactis]|uniref:acetyl/propionyl/methylcrotonyl-CoA carboxylase subunit alpha n=1 Tax=Streptomyces lunaelactis TaxID=1535768 RepID=UPI0015850FC6|nr:biotin carboxylase N-terminal domain-containing protein [Streptomyces lunaelactis]NUK09839.1 ATP-grasp domain-containing protein [Streptomyces lunaelactis]NUK59755.1 ATP-grasp domain-containing protein [Streptomyces lunaelactis]NUL11656.1 ATP-grasp domain-containing protein [Streptomyces lunaelactis]
MIQSLLVANRGEIACRVFRTCRELGISTVAVHSDADASALHVREADAAVRLPGAAPADTYLRGDLIVKAALAAGADAVHPGYGFLSENAEFARAVLDAGLVWIGPPPSAIEAMASKTRAKELMGLAPLAEVTEADLPVLVKAAAGGGGRGMRIVRSLSALAGELEAARSEAASAFGDGEVFLEPYIERGRHVEVQVLADAHGTVWALGTRDCSLQRRHQKVIEESPAPGLAPSLVETLHESAVSAARAVGYRGAGTVEFLVSPDGRAHFLEMNTRLQVEHPVTEAVFGLDLVALQLRVAEGAALPEAAPRASGHAVEARLYAEDPSKGWTPQTGVLHALEVPGAAPGLRVDTGYGAGDSIGVHYDPMIAKVIAWAPTRHEAVRRLAHALRRARVHGPVTNRELLVRSLEHPEFTGAQLDTGFYERNLDALTVPGDGERYAAVAAALADAASRGGRFGGWRNVASQPQLKVYGEHEVRYRAGRDGYVVEDVAGLRVVDVAPDRVRLELDGVVRNFGIAAHGDQVYVDSPLGTCTLTARPRFADPQDRALPGSLLAPMPGTVVRVGDGLGEGVRVTQGQPLVWLEAMKMEHRIVSPASGILTALHAVPGRQVEVGALLAVVQEEDSAS